MPPPREQIGAGPSEGLADRQPFSHTPASMSALPPAVASWRDQIERLSEHASPCRYLTPSRWAAMRANALAFIDQHGAEAHRLGWTAEQLFGVHPEHGSLRVEYAGALMVNDSPVIGVEQDRIVFDRFSGYRTKPGQIWGPPVWEYAVKGR
jgi:hypothetical protein